MCRILTSPEHHEEVESEIDQDTDLFLAYRNGDTDALSVLVHRTAQHMHHIALQFVHDEQIAEDMVQISWIKVVENASTFVPYEKFEAWFLSILRNTCFDYLRRQKSGRHVKLTLLADFDTDHSAESFFVAPTSSNTSVPLDQLHFAINQLSEIQQELIRLVLNGYSMSRIATAKNMKIPTIKSRYSAAKKRIRKIFKDYQN